MARTTMDPVLDDRRDAHGRRLALVCAGHHSAALGRAAALFGGGCSGFRCDCWNHSVQGAEALEPPAPALSAGAALLVEGLATRQIFLSFGPYHDGVLHRSGTQLLLSIT